MTAMQQTDGGRVGFERPVRIDERLGSLGAISGGQ